MSMFRSTFLSACALATAMTLAPATGHAKVFHSRESALRLAFPGAARVEPVHLFLSEAELEACTKLARARCEERVVRAYVGYDAHGQAIAHAFIDTHIVRTMPETFMLVIAPDGTIVRVEVLAFHEPEAYLPPGSWLQRLVGDKLRRLRSRQHVDSITGATMTANALTGATRRLLAVHRIKVRRASDAGAP